MNALQDHDPGVAAQAAAARVAEIRTLFARIRAVLDHSLRITDDLDDDTPRKLIVRMDQLIAAHLKVLAAEEIFDAAQTANSIDPVDLDTIRDDLGRRLDRLRVAIGAGGVSGGAD